MLHAAVVEAVDERVAGIPERQHGRQEWMISRKKNRRDREQKPDAQQRMKKRAMLESAAKHAQRPAAEKMNLRRLRVNVRQQSRDRADRKKHKRHFIARGNQKTQPN